MVFFLSEKASQKRRLCSATRLEYWSVLGFFHRIDAYGVDGLQAKWTAAHAQWPSSESRSPSKPVVNKSCLKGPRMIISLNSGSGHLWHFLQATSLMDGLAFWRKANRLLNIRLLMNVFWIDAGCASTLRSTKRRTRWSTPRTRKAIRGQRRASASSCRETCSTLIIDRHTAAA